jgi:branched-chain amino acid aminotransferase
MDACRCGISSWRRPADNVIPPSAKITGLYINNAFTKTEAVDKGFDEGIMLSPDGYVSEGSGENLFMLKDGRLVTPPVNNNILVGITRDTTMTLAKNELGIDTIERSIDPEELFRADECFLTGTAAHITPIAEIDGRKIGNGYIGEVAGKLQKIYFDIIKGNNPKYIEWCTPVYKK